MLLSPQLQNIYQVFNVALGCVVCLLLFCGSLADTFNLPLHLQCEEIFFGGGWSGVMLPSAMFQIHESCGCLNVLIRWEE